MQVNVNEYGLESICFGLVKQANDKDYLWIGQHGYVNRQDVEEIIAHLMVWIDTGSLKIEGVE